MIRTKLVTANATPVELSFPDEVQSYYKIIITNLSANKHILVGGPDVSLTKYGIRVEHDQPPVTIEGVPYNDRLYAISEDPLQSISVAVMVIE
jgi:hypothetical protein